GTTMTDVIFSGSKSSSAHIYAYVKLFLDNSDNFVDLEYNEIEVTRKVYRSGESEYLLNGTKCRLKDISDLMMDTGLGKESFNIISQDKVQSLLNSKPEDRRYIFEEAAGVLKYRKRKESAERKLKTTYENLMRVNDILNELENQVGPLKVQSENAKKYLAAKEELESVEIALIAHEIHEYSEEYRKMSKEKELINESITSLSVDEYNTENRIEKIKEELKLIDSNLESYNQKLIELTNSINETKAEKKLFDERRKYSIESSAVIENRSNLLTRELEVIEKVDNVKKQLSQVKSEKDKLENQYKIKEESHQELLSKRRKYRDEYNTLDSQIISQKSKITAFEQNNSRSLFSGVAAVLNAPMLNGIIDVVSNVVDIDQKYAVAMDYAFSSSNQYIICESKGDAKNAIEYLNKNKKGRATFMPLDNIKNNAREFNFSKYDSILGFASDLINYDDKYKNVIESLIGNVVIADDLDSANKFFKECSKFRIITLNGEIINPRGSITGGNNNNKKGFFTARHEYESSKKQVIEYEKRLEEVSTLDLEINRDITNSDEELYKLKISLMQINESYGIKQDTLNELVNSSNEIKKELASLSSISNNKEDEEELRIISLIKKYQEELTSVTTEIDKLKFEKTDKLVISDDLYDKFKAISSQVKNDKKQINEIEIKLSRLDVKLENHLLRLSEEYSLTYEKAFEEFQLSIDIVDAKSKVKVLKSKINALGHVNINAIEEYEVVKERFDFLSTQKADILNAKEELEITIGELDKTMKDQFFETFEEVSKQYSIMFKQLFGGGNATLSLTDSNDLLNTGIEISAQPPGKKLQHLTLLSGGEKALSTLVLLFAILKVRPVPFCILDEVEAALDEANLARFAHFLEGFSNYIQFIIITHRKVTMENADVLYGVTMQESGVSKFVSVRLSEASDMIGGAK
ncbi:MAG: hypothetical protein ACK5K7_02250, partial [Bacilli bacterium]